MPNWCNNYVEIDGNKGTLQRIKNKIKGKGNVEALSLNSIIPLPKILEDKGWYQWRLDNWGTKWDIEGAFLDESENSLGYGFDSAWGPPIEAFITLSMQFPTVEIKMEYDEGGCELYGELILKGGDVRKDEEYTYEEWLEAKDGDYRKMKDFILSMPPKDIGDNLKEIQECIEMYSPLEKYLVNRIEHKDLPLYINYEWHDSENEERYTERMKDEI